MTHMYGVIDEEPCCVMRVKLTGFDGRTKIMTGRRDVLWREFTRGNGGPAHAKSTMPSGWKLWTPIPLIQEEEAPSCA